MELTDKIRRVYLPMTETGFYILFCLQKENHGYGITQKVKEMTDSQILISPGTMYGTLSKMEKDGLIAFVLEEEKRKIYQITDLGRKVLEIELKRIERLYRNSREEGCWKRKLFTEFLQLRIMRGRLYTLEKCMLRAGNLGK